MARGRIAAAVAIYGALGAVAWIACAVAGRSPWHLAVTFSGTRWISLPIALVAGGLVGRSTAALSQRLAQRSSWGRDLDRELRRGLYGMTADAVAPIALASSIGEELFFRGALQTGLVASYGAIMGVALTALLFGIAHVPWNRRLRTWTVTATVMGGVFGVLYLATGELIAPIVAHAVINNENLRFMLREEAEA